MGCRGKQGVEAESILISSNSSQLASELDHMLVTTGVPEDHKRQLCFQKLPLVPDLDIVEQTTTRVQQCRHL